SAPRRFSIAGEISRTPPPRLVHQVNGVPVRQEIIRPAAAAIRRALKIDGGLPTTVNHHQGIGVAALRRYLVLHVHLSQHRAAVPGPVVPPASEKTPLVRDFQ